jgi:hypothetical protein
MTATHQAKRHGAFVESYFDVFKKSFLSKLDRCPAPLSNNSCSAWPTSSVDASMNF